MEASSKRRLFGGSCRLPGVKEVGSATTRGCTENAAEPFPTMTFGHLVHTLKCGSTRFEALPPRPGSIMAVLCKTAQMSGDPAQNKLDASPSCAELASDLWCNSVLQISRSSPRGPRCAQRSRQARKSRRGPAETQAIASCRAASPACRSRPRERAEADLREWWPPYVRPTMTRHRPETRPSGPVGHQRLGMPSLPNSPALHLPLGAARASPGRRSGGASTLGAAVRARGL